MKSFTMYRTHEYTLCRLCLCNGGCLVDIFEENNKLDFVVETAIEDLLQLKVAKEAGFPWLVCFTCLEKLTEFRLFKRQCVECQLVFDNRVKRVNCPRAKGWKNIENKAPIKTEEESDDSEVADHSGSTSTDVPQGVDNVGGMHPDISWHNSNTMGAVVTPDLQPHVEVETAILKNTEMGHSQTGRVAEMTEEDEHADSRVHDMSGATSRSADKPTGDGEWSALRKLLLNGWRRGPEEHVEANSAQGEMVLSDSAFLDGGAHSEEVTFKLENENLNSEMPVASENDGSVGARVEPNEEVPCGSTLRRLLEDNSTTILRGKNCHASARSERGLVPVGKRQSRAKKVKLVNGRRSSKSCKDEGLICCDRVGGLKISPGNAVEASSFDSNRPSENSRPRDMEVEGEDVSQQTVAGAGDLDTCMEVYFNKGILKALLLDHTWTSSLKTKRRIVGPYPIATIEQDVPGSLVNRNTCPESPGNCVSSPPSPSNNRTGSTEVETVEGSDLASRRLNFSSANIVSECNDGISQADAISYESDKSLISKNVEERYLSDSSNLTVNSNGLDENGTCELGPGGEDIAITLRSPQENSVSSVDGECQSQTSHSTDPDANVTHGEIPLVERESEVGDQGVKNSFVTGDESDVGVVSVKGNEEEIPVPCLLCSNMFPCGASLRKHMRVDHPESCKKCTICFRVLSSVKSMQSHLEVHKKEREFLCDVCGCTFANAAYLEKHLQGHPTSRAHECSECQEVFSELPEFKEHVKTHLNSSYSCVFCDRTFGNRVNLKTHLVSHSNEGRHRCDTCQRSFPYKTLLRAHLREHWKLYLCEVCGKEMHYSRFQRHIRSHEPYEVW